MTAGVLYFKHEIAVTKGGNKMAAFVIDSELFRDQYGTEAMRKVFSDEQLMQNWLDCWAALAQAEAALGIVPQEAAEHIAQCAKSENMDMEAVRKGFAATCHPLMPQIREFERVCGAKAGGWIHWGATTQDIMDTAVVLQIKAAHKIITEQVKKLTRLCLERAQENKSVVMAGRTHGQHAVPITLGYKIAVWAAEFARHLERLEEGKPRYLVGELAGAAGTLASLGEQGLAVQEGFCHKLGLGVPLTTWHVARDGFAEFASTAAMIAGTVGKIANEFINLERTEICELEEGFSMGKVGSSTMPHKRNPMVCENILANCRIIQANAGLGFGAMIQEHERDMSFWQTEWSYLPQICILLDNVMSELQKILQGMIVRKGQIKHNLYLTKGLIVSEHVMLTLGHYLGRQNAHEVIYEASMKAFEQNRMLEDVLKEDERVTSKISNEILDEVLEPMHYTGACEAMVERVVRKLANI